MSDDFDEMGGCMKCFALAAFCDDHQPKIKRGYSMTLMQYLETTGVAQFNIEEDHIKSVVLVKTSRPLTEAEQERCVELCVGFSRVEFKAVF